MLDIKAEMDIITLHGGEKIVIYCERIEINPTIMLGKPVIKGTRIPVYVILNLLSEGYDMERVIEEYPDLEKKDILAALKFAAKTTQFEELTPAPS